MSLLQCQTATSAAHFLREQLASKPAPQAVELVDSHAVEEGEALTEYLYSDNEQASEAEPLKNIPRDEHPADTAEIGGVFVRGS